MTTTPNLGLKKPASSEPLDVAPLNDNSDTLDAFAGEVNESLDGKQDTLTFDTAPTEDSTNPVTSGGVKTDQDRQDTLEAEDRAALVELVDGGAKNLLDILDACGYIGQAAEYPISVGGVIFSKTADGGISTSGSSTSVKVLRIPVALSAGTYHFSGCPSGGGSSSYRIDFRVPGTETFIGGTDTGNGVVISFGETTALDFCIRIGANYSGSVDFMPMICTKAAWDISQKFVPYRPSWDELVSRIEALENS